MRPIATIMTYCGTSAAALAHSLPAEDGFAAQLGHHLSSPHHLLWLLPATIVTVLALRHRARRATTK